MKVRDIKEVLFAHVLVVSQSERFNCEITHFEGDLMAKDVDPEVLEKEIIMIQVISCSNKIRILVK